MKAATKRVAVGVGLVGLGLGLWWFLRGRRSVQRGSSIEEWSPFPGLSPALVGGSPPPCTCPSGFTPTRDASGACRCSPVSVEVLAVLGARCTKSSQCASGNCINGRCVSELELL